VTEPLGAACLQKARADLEWDRVLEALAERAAGPLGARAARQLELATSREGVRRALEECREASDLAAAAEPLAGGGAPMVDASLDRLEAGGALGPAELGDLGALLRHARALRRFLAARRDRAPRLHEACDTDPRLDDLERLLRDAFDDDGTLSDRASPRLRELRAERAAARERLLRRLEEVMQRHASALQDRFVTEREGRFVLPVRSDSHERFAGIVHAASASGQTLFMEPRVVIPLGNRLKMLDAEIEREHAAVYARLSADAAERLESIAAAQRALAHAELRAACARLAADLELGFPSVVDEPVLELWAMRHPLLVLDGVRVVAADVRVEAGRALVLSGPNAGGKTVVLKTLGLVALMARAGLPVPCRADSRVGVFERVASDMGDDQSIARNLSTFSAHVRNLASILDEASHGALVLLDEVATGTDPREGEALACAVLDGLCARGAAVACTTHYEGLKALALGDGRFVNASVGFDFATMSPTFELATGVPGESSAFAIARRFGMPSLVVDRAERFLGGEERGFEQLVRRLNDERRALELARVSAEREALGARESRRALEAELAAVRARERRQLSREAEALLGAVRRAREELRAAEQRLRSRKLDEGRLHEASKIVERVARQVSIGGALEPPREPDSDRGELVDPAELRAGQRVWVPRVRAEARVVEVLDEERVRVAAGPLKMTVGMHELRTAAQGEPGIAAPRARAPVPLDAASDPQSPIQTDENKCDLRGLRVDEAIAMAEQFLDRSLNEGRRVAFLVHGHGTGALRDALRAWLGTSRYVSRSRPGEHGEGGDGVTVVWLR
jgi:DNA mismatch repair protein MutS2